MIENHQTLFRVLGRVKIDSVQSTRTKQPYQKRRTNSTLKRNKKTLTLFIPFDNSIYSNASSIIHSKKLRTMAEASASVDVPMEDAAAVPPPVSFNLFF